MSTPGTLPSAENLGHIKIITQTYHQHCKYFTSGVTIYMEARRPCVTLRAYQQAVMKFRPTVDLQLLTTCLSGNPATKACQYHLTKVKRRRVPQGRLPPSFKFREKGAYFGYNYISISILLKSILSSGLAFGLLLYSFFIIF